MAGHEYVSDMFLFSFMLATKRCTLTCLERCRFVMVNKTDSKLHAFGPRQRVFHLLLLSKNIRRGVSKFVCALRMFRGPVTKSHFCERGRCAI